MLVRGQQFLFLVRHPPCFDLTNLMKNPTCFCKDANPSLVDVILINKPTSCGKICNFDCGISDVHNIISVQFKSEMPQKAKSKRLFRSYKNFDNEFFLLKILMN